MNSTAKKGNVTIKRILLGVTGGVAAYKAAELARILTQSGINVQTVMTESACRFVCPMTFQSLTGNPVCTNLWDTNAANNMAHINLSRMVDAILVAPASADFIARIASGMADDLLATLCLARDCSLMLAPSMNRQMWENPATQRNIHFLQGDGVIVFGPASGEQACGEIGMGRMLEPSELMDAMRGALQPKLLQDQNVLITAGPTYEPIDAVRGITNISSGKMGYAIARAAVEAGANVTLVSGPTCIKAPVGTRLFKVMSAHDMLNKVKTEISAAHIFISVAAVADYRAAKIQKQKIKRTNEKLTLLLEPNPDILSYVSNLHNAPFCVGFAAETENLERNAECKRKNKKLQLLVGNLAQDVIGADECELILFDEQGKHFLSKATKYRQAENLIKHISERYKAYKKNGSNND